MLRRVFAILPTLGIFEILGLLVLGVVLFGRDLPQVGRSLGRTIAQLRRGLQEFKDQMDRDESLREVRDAVRDTRRELDDVTRVPRAIADPRRALRGLADEAMAPLPGEEGRAAREEPVTRAAQDLVREGVREGGSADADEVPADPVDPVDPATGEGAVEQPEPRERGS